MGQILAAIQTVFEIIKLARGLVDFINENKTEAWFQESAKVFTKLRDAKTPKERQDAAKNIRDLLRGI